MLWSGWAYYCFYSYTLGRLNQLSSGTINTRYQIVLARYSQLDLPPEAPSFITRVCGFGFHILRRQFEQARRVRSPQIAQALGALQRVFGCPEMSAV